MSVDGIELDGRTHGQKFNKHHTKVRDVTSKATTLQSAHEFRNNGRRQRDV